jgi:hypothetical protein
MVTLLRPYCTLEEVRVECKNSTTDNDELYLRCINLASRYIENICKRDFWFHDHTTTPFRVPRSQVLGNEISLKSPVRTLTDVRVWFDPRLETSVEYSLKPEEYYFEEDSDTISIEPHYTWRGGWAPMQALGNTGNTGYAGEPSFWHGSNGLSSLNPTEDQMGLPYPFRGIIELYGTFGYALEDGVGADQKPPPLLPAAIRRSAVIVAAAWSYERAVQQVGLDGSTVNLLDNRITLEVEELLEHYAYMTNSNF